MPYDEGLAQRIRERLESEEGVTEKQMFGGLAFMVGGNVAVAASHDGGLLIRVDPADTEECVARPNASQMEMRGRAMKGWIRVASEGVSGDDELEAWVEEGLGYARSLPPK